MRRSGNFGESRSQRDKGERSAEPMQYSRIGRRTDRASLTRESSTDRSMSLLYPPAEAIPCQSHMTQLAIGVRDGRLTDGTSISSVTAEAERTSGVLRSTR